MERCPHCRAPIYSDLPWNIIGTTLVHKNSGKVIKLYRHEPKVLQKLLEKYPNPILKGSLIYDLWVAEDKEEPEDANSRLVNIFSSLRKVLKPVGLNIVRRGQGLFALEKYNE